jgi:hypothetical protein
MTDDLFPIAARELVNHLGDLLRWVWLLNRKRQAHNQEESDEAQNYQQFQRKRIVDGSSRVGGMNANSLQQCSHGPAEEMIQ